VPPIRTGKHPVEGLGDEGRLYRVSPALLQSPHGDIPVVDVDAEYPLPHHRLVGDDFVLPVASLVDLLWAYLVVFAGEMD